MLLCGGSFWYFACFLFFLFVPLIPVTSNEQKDEDRVALMAETENEAGGRGRPDALPPAWCALRLLGIFMGFFPLFILVIRF